MLISLLNRGSLTVYIKGTSLWQSCMWRQLLFLYGCRSWVDMRWHCKVCPSFRTPATGGGKTQGDFHFWVFCSFTALSCITLCVDFKWLNKLVVFPWGADTVVWHILHNIFVCSESDYYLKYNLFYFPNAWSQVCNNVSCWPTAVSSIVQAAAVFVLLCLLQLHVSVVQ